MILNTRHSRLYQICVSTTYSIVFHEVIILKSVLEEVKCDPLPQWPPDLCCNRNDRTKHMASKTAEQDGQKIEQDGLREREASLFPSS
jgi:hypothetical protein